VPQDVDPTKAGDRRAYVNNREGLTPPHMKGRDTKRLALLLPFSASSPRLAQEAQSMFRAAELAVFEREGADVLLVALDTKGTEAGTISATRAALSTGADVILGPVLPIWVRTMATAVGCAANTAPASSEISAR